eukprot:UN31859
MNDDAAIEILPEQSVEDESILIKNIDKSLLTKDPTKKNQLYIESIIASELGVPCPITTIKDTEFFDNNVLLVFDKPVLVGPIHTHTLKNIETKCQKNNPRYGNCIITKSKIPQYICLTNMNNDLAKAAKGPIANLLTKSYSSTLPINIFQYILD